MEPSLNSLPRGPMANRLLLNSTYFQKNEGDHVVLHSINQVMLFHMEAECRRFISYVIIV